MDTKLPEEYKGAISNTIYIYGRKPYKSRRWTEEEEDWMLNEKDFNTINELSYLMDRSADSISQRLKKIAKENDTYNEPNRWLKYHFNHKFVTEYDIKTVLDLYAGDCFYKKEFKDKLEVTSNDESFKFYSINDYHLDAHDCIKMLFESGKKYDLIDLDPFGNAYNCFDMAIKMATKGLIITFGEMGHIRFKRLDFVGKRYGIKNISEFTLEKLTDHIVKLGELNGKKIIPVYMKKWGHIGRVYFKID